MESAWSSRSTTFSTGTSFGPTGASSNSPRRWRIEPTTEDGVATVVDAEGTRRQVLQVAGRSQYEDVIDGALYSGDLLGFEVGRDYGQFIRRRFVSASAHGYDVRSIFSAGDAAVVGLGEAVDVEGLKLQLTSSATSIPWHYWIESVKGSTAGLLRLAGNLRRHAAVCV